MSLPNRAYSVKVTYRGNIVKEKTSIIGGPPMTAEQLSEHFERFNLFPGAVSVEIQAMTGSVPHRLQDVLRSRSAIAKNLKPLTTPKATILEPEQQTEDEKEAAKFTATGGRPYAGDGISSGVPASPVDSPAANEARRIASASQESAGTTVTAQGTPTGTPPDSQGAGQGETPPPQSEASQERSAPVAGGQGGSRPGKTPK